MVEKIWDIYLYTYPGNGVLEVSSEAFKKMLSRPARRFENFRWCGFTSKPRRFRRDVMKILNIIVITLNLIISLNSCLRFHCILIRTLEEWIGGGPPLISIFVL